MAGIDYMRKIMFSGIEWEVRETEKPAGPQNNRFSSSEESVWVDAKGLHLAIRKRGGRWYGSEVMTKASLGYGTYVFLVSSRVDQLDKNVVCGLFTWNSESFRSDANSEIDIEFSKWGKPAYSTKNSLYAVNPTGRKGEDYPERKHRFDTKLHGDRSTHAFTWTSEWISFASYHGHGCPTPFPINKWFFDKDNTPRIASEGSKISKPVLIPKPRLSTNARINLWLLNKTQPSNGKEVEVTISRFAYFPSESGGRKC